MHIKQATRWSISWQKTLSGFALWFKVFANDMTLSSGLVPIDATDRTDWSFKRSCTSCCVWQPPNTVQRGSVTPRGSIVAAQMEEAKKWLMPLEQSGCQIVAGYGLSPGQGREQGRIPRVDKKKEDWKDLTTSAPIKAQQDVVKT